MPTRNIVLTDNQDQFVGNLIKDGKYKSASEVMRASLRLLEDRVAQREAELADIRSGVLEGYRQAKAGEFIEGSIEETVSSAFDRAGLDRKR
ncbi:MAG: type II toxin-antitoxin system ParD family antitoxin [Rhodospirillales bacterium]|nr:type II toxin-antitoxin system ParD family antitoxin [Rhodospirillales bacterium]